MSGGANLSPPEVSCRGTRLAVTDAMRWPSSRASLVFLIVAGCGSSSAVNPDGAARGQAFDVCAAASDCSAGLGCICGICTKPCTASNECAAPATCPALTPDKYDCQDRSKDACLITCSNDTDCKTLGSTAVCTGGLCRRPTLVTVVDGGVLTCAERTAQISSEVQATLSPVIANADRTCKVDADCTQVGIGASCYLGGCGGVDVSSVGSASIMDALKAIEIQDCRAFVAAGCAFSGGIINCPAEGFPTCVSGRCQDSLSITPSDAGSSQ
jgi:hypothetical protein